MHDEQSIRASAGRDATERVKACVSRAPDVEPRVPRLACALTPDELDYRLPETLIATRPAQPRDSARMMVIRRGTDEVVHSQVRDLPDWLRAEDLLVFNDSKVVPARLIGRRAETGGKVEGLYLGEVHRHSSDEFEAYVWYVMLKSNGRLRPRTIVELLDHDGRPGGFRFELMRKHDDAWEVRSEDHPDDALQRLGRTPLPPYILRARTNRAEDVEDAADRAWYQTVYARQSHAGSVAAPTAGLHFTQQLRKRIKAIGVRQARVTLHVGPGTFKPVTAATLGEHAMHCERFKVDARALKELRASCERPRCRLLAVGTTTVRTLESLPEGFQKRGLSPIGPHRDEFSGETDLLIAPPYDFKHVGGMLTNFHLPRSTLLALVAAMVGLERLKSLYAEAVRLGYRFYSYGDAMLILP